MDKVMESNKNNESKNNAIKVIMTVLFLFLFGLGAYYLSKSDVSSQNELESTHNPQPTTIESVNKRKLNYEKAKNAGYSDRQIYNYLQDNPEVDLSHHPNPDAFYEKYEKGPTSIARSTAAVILTKLNSTEREKLISNLTNEEGDIVDATRELAWKLDEDPDLFALALAAIGEQGSNSQTNNNTSLDDIEWSLWKINETLEDIRDDQ